MKFRLAFVVPIEHLDYRSRVAETYRTVKVRPLVHPPTHNLDLSEYTTESTTRSLRTTNLSSGSWSMNLCPAVVSSDVSIPAKVTTTCVSYTPLGISIAILAASCVFSTTLLSRTSGTVGSSSPDDAKNPLRFTLIYLVRNL